MKKLLATLMVLLTLTGCDLFESPKPVELGTLHEVTVGHKRFEQVCVRGCWNNFYVTFTKGDQKIELHVGNERMFNALAEGSVVNVSYDDSYAVMKIQFPKLEGEVK